MFSKDERGYDPGQLYEEVANRAYTVESVFGPGASKPHAEPGPRFRRAAGRPRGFDADRVQVVRVKKKRFTRPGETPETDFLKPKF